MFIGVIIIWIDKGEGNMKKKWPCIVTIIIIVIGLFSTGMLSGRRKECINDIEFTKEIVVKNGQVVSETSCVPILLDKDGVFAFHTDWNAKNSGIVTAMMIYNEAGEIAYEVAGEDVGVTSKEIELRAGIYKVQFRFLSRNVFSKENVLTQPVDGTYEIMYNFKMDKYSTGAYNIDLLVGCLCGLLVCTFLIIVFMKVTKNNKMIICRYDERQLQAKGKGYQYGFFTYMIYNGMLGVFHIVRLELPIDEAVLILIGIWLGIVVYVIYCIKERAYIALNENIGKLNVVFIVMSAVNILVGIISVLSGIIVEEGRVTWRIFNLIVGVSVLGIVFIMNHYNRNMEKALDKAED